MFHAARQERVRFRELDLWMGSGGSPARKPSGGNGAHGVFSPKPFFFAVRLDFSQVGRGEKSDRTRIRGEERKGGPDLFRVVIRGEQRFAGKRIERPSGRLSPSFIV